MFIKKSSQFTGKGKTCSMIWAPGFMEYLCDNVTSAEEARKQFYKATSL